MKIQKQICPHCKKDYEVANVVVVNNKNLIFCPCCYCEIEEEES